MLSGKAVTIENVSAALDELTRQYQKQRKAALDAIRKPYQLRRRKLLRLLDVLKEEQAASTTNTASEQ